jgi:hypothetical protein
MFFAESDKLAHLNSRAKSRASSVSWRFFAILVWGASIVAYGFGCSENSLSKRTGKNRPSDESEAIPGLLTEKTTEPGLPTVVRTRRAEVAVPADAFNKPVKIRVREVSTDELSSEQIAVLVDIDESQRDFIEVSMVDAASGMVIQSSDVSSQMGMVEGGVFLFRQVIESPSDRGLVKLQLAHDYANDIVGQTLAGSQLRLVEGDLDAVNQSEALTVEATMNSFQFVASAVIFNTTVIGTSKLALQSGEEFKILGIALHNDLEIFLDQTVLTPISVSSNAIVVAVPSNLAAGPKTLSIYDLEDEIFRAELNIKAEGQGSSGADTGGSAGETSAGTTGSGSDGGGQSNEGFHRLFATEAVYNGNLGGMNFAHQECREAAKTSFHSGAGDYFYKTYRAILAVVGMGARDYTIGTSNWQVKNSNSTSPELLAGSVSELFGDGSGRQNVDIYTEAGQAPLGQVWTGALSTGAYDNGNTCSNWTSISGTGKMGHVNQYPAGQYLSNTQIPCS